MNSLLSEGLARVFCSSKASICWHSAFFMVQLLHLYMITGLKVQSKGAGKALFPLVAFLASLQPSGDCWGSLVFLGLCYITLISASVVTLLPPFLSVPSSLLPLIRTLAFAFRAYADCFCCSVTKPNSFQHHGLYHAVFPVLRYLPEFAQTQVH